MRGVGGDDGTSASIPGIHFPDSEHPDPRRRREMKEKRNEGGGEVDEWRVKERVTLDFGSSCSKRFQLNSI